MGCCLTSHKIGVSNTPLPIIVKKEPQKNNNFYWGYEADSGPEHWAKHYPNAACTHQSPIDIKTADAEFDKQLEENQLVINYPMNCFNQIENNGHTFVVTGINLGNVSGGQLKNLTFNLLSFHMHWGRNDSEGSEHLLNGKQYSAEIHFVNWNAEKYAKAEDAVNTNIHDGLLVLGVLIKTGKENAEFETIINSLKDIKLASQKTLLSRNLDPKNLLPAKCSEYYIYDGSLTTPPCNEAAKHIVFQDPIEVSNEQLKQFRELYECSNLDECCEKFKIQRNFRPICPLNGRKVYKSFNN